MRSSKRTKASLKSSTQHDPDICTELSTAWKSLAQSKVALRHIENRLEVGPGTGVVLDSLMDSTKKKSSRTVRCREGRQVDDSGASTKQRRHSQQSPEKSSSRSPLRNSTQDSNVRRNNSVEFREPLASYREATPPPHPSSQLELYSLQSVPGYSPTPSNPLLGQLVYQRDTRDKQTDRDLDSTHSSALESTEVRYLNDQPALDTLRTFKNQSHPGTETDSYPKAQFSQSMDSRALTPGSVPRGGSTPSTSPGSASQRLENLRRHQPDDKLEKLKERIRRQRQHLEETAEREKLLSYLEQPIMAAVQTSNGGTGNMPTAKVRKVAAAPPAPIYKGFNSTETKIRTPDGKVWKEEEYHNLSREIYRDLSQQFADSSMSRQQKEQRVDASKERRPPKPVRKVQRVAPASDLNAKPVISPASWRDGQKLVKMVLGPVPKSPREEKCLPLDRKSKTVAHRCSSSDQCSELTRQSRPNSRERPHRSKSHSTTTNAGQNKATVGESTDILSADIQGILNDLQLECKAAENEERARQRSRGGCSGKRGRGGSGSRTRAPVSAWGTTVTTGSSRGCRSASPSTHRPNTADTTELSQKKRHYDADTVRQYIAQQQEKRKRRQAEEKRVLKEEAEQRNQRLQELYRKQREAARTVGLPTQATVAPVQKRLQETYTKLLLEGVQLEEEATQTLPGPAPSQLRPMYQPSGESDKENKRLEPPQSPSSSDRSLNDQPPPPLSRNDLDYGVASLLQPDRLIPAVRPMTGTNDHLLSQLLRLETALAEGDAKHAQRPATAPNRSRSKMSRIEALKATAASLSNRIENEARKLAGDGINYGAATTLDMDSLVATRSSHTGHDKSSWIQANSKEVENNDMGFRNHKILTSAGHSSYNGTALPGTGNQTFKGLKEKNIHHNSPQTISANITGYTLNSHTPERRQTNGLETIERIDKLVQRSGYGAIDKDDKHDTSSGSISEGPLSEGSLSDGEPSPSHPTHNHVSIPVDRLEALEYRAAKRGHHQRLSEFQKEAESCIALTSLFAQQDGSKAAWEELNKGSPLSVINIFTKNLHGYIKVSEGNSERNSPSGHSLHSGNGPGDVAVYEDDFVSTNSSGASGQLKKGSNTPSVNSHFEELLRRSPYEKNSGGTNSHHSSFHSSVQSPCLSSGSTSGSSPRSKNSTRKRGTASDHSDATLVEEQRNSCSPPSEVLSSESRKKGSERSSTHSQAKSGPMTTDMLGQVSGLSHQSLGLDAKKSPPGRLRQSSPGSPDLSSPVRAHSPSDPLRGSLLETGHTGRTTETRTTGELQYSPAVLQQRMAAELHYLETIEESARQLGDIERLMDVSLAQQESASLAQMLKAKQQRHEHDLYELKIKAEREALETKLQLEENKQRVARAHIELQESLAAAQKQTLEGLQEATTKMMSQQAEAARYTAETARHIKEMTEMTHTQVTGALIVPPVATEPSDQQEHSSHMKQRREKADSDSFPSEMSSRGSRPDEPLSSLNSLNHSDSVPFRRPELSGADSSSHPSPSNVSSHSEVKWRRGTSKERTERDEGSTSIEEEVPTAVNDSLCSDSIPSVVDEKADSTSVATEYSFKFDESMTEDEIEERSFRSLLPSEAHRRWTLDKKSRHHDESEEDGTAQNSTLLSGSHNMLKPQDVNMAFSGGQDSFSQFTMDMVRQYMKDEEVRLQHQSALLHLRQKALKEKARTELAWLEHQKKRLRGKGEDDKMPPIRKKQRGLLMKLQQEQAEIKRLQEANKAARKERQLLLKQQEEIERMRSSTLRLKERLKCAGAEAPPETPVSMVSEAASSDMRHADTDVRSPSPSLSISGSETSSIMQKLKKMRSHMDEKHCSPVHYFFSVFTAHHWASLSVCLPNLHPKFQLFICNQLVRFLTKREQQLMQRRHHAEELLQWKQRLDREEAEVRRIEKEALAVWDHQTPPGKVHNFSETQKKEISDVSPSSSHQRRSEPRTDSEKDYVSEGDISSVTPESCINTEGPVTEHPESPSSVKPVSARESPLTSIQSSAANYTQEFTSASPSTSRKSVQSSPVKGSYSATASPSDSSGKSKMQLGPTSTRPNQAHTEPSESLMGTQTEPLSDQSDIECRIRALKEELRKRKFMACQLKKEQKKRHKERLKAQEASLLKQLETYNNFIEKTKAELNTEPSSTPDTKSQIKDAISLAEQPSIKPPSHRFESSKISYSARTHIHPSLDNNSSALPDQSTSTSVPEQLPDEDPPTVTPTVTPVLSSPESLTSSLRNHQASEGFLRPLSSEAHTPINESGDENIVSDHRSALQEELEVDISNKSKDQHSEHLLKLQKKDTIDSQTRMSASEHISPSVSGEHHYPPSVHSEQDGQIEARQTSEADVCLGSHSAPVDLKMTPQSDHSHSTDSLAFSSKGMCIKDNETSSPLADGYHDDFESSVDSSPRGGHHTSKPASELSFPPPESKPLSKDKPSRPILYDSQNEEVEEEIPEELSHRSFASDASHQSERLLDLHDQTQDSKHDTRSTINSTHLPNVTSVKTPSSPLTDQMPDFNIGDRVLVSGVQPGTLRFKGPTSFANGFWAGVELDKSEGSNNGTYDGVLYFECDDHHGIFAPPDRITHLTDKFEMYTDTTEDDDSFFDDMLDEGRDTSRAEERKLQKQGHLSKGKQTSQRDCRSDSLNVTDESVHQVGTHINLHHYKESMHPVANGKSGDIILDFADAIVTSDIRDDKGEQRDKNFLGTVADKLLHNFVNDTVRQFAEIKKAKKQKIDAANQMNGHLFENDEEEWMTSVEQKDGLPFFLTAEKEELSSPELCNRPESPVLGASGQEELAKRLAELELSRELLDELGDDQDWFDEDFGLSSRREQQKLKQKQREEEEQAKLGGGFGRSSSPSGAAIGGLVSPPGGEQQVKTPPRPELPLPLPPKLPEQPAMVVPHSAVEVQKMVYAATQEIWETFALEKEGAMTLTQLPNPKPSQEYLGNEANSQDQEAICICSYRKAVYDLTWEILQEIYSEDPNTNQPQWVKPRRVKPSFYQRVKTPGDISKIQEFLSAEVLKLYGLTKDQSQKSDWQKMLKFGRKKRDRVDHILVQELHEEEAQWVNYDEDELFVKMQLADSIFDALLKDTTNVLTQIYDKQAQRDNVS